MADPNAGMRIVAKAEYERRVADHRAEYLVAETKLEKEIAIRKAKNNLGYADYGRFIADIWRREGY